MSNKIFNNRTAKGLVSLITIIILLSSILAISIFYQSSITGYATKETSIDSESITIPIQQVNDIKELNQLNEGWYEIRNGYVFYLETFNSYVPLWIKVKNTEQQNGLISIDIDGNIEFNNKNKQSIEKELVGGETEVKLIATTITGKVTGLEKVSGFAVSYTWYVPKKEGGFDIRPNKDSPPVSGSGIRYQKTTTNIAGKKDTLEDYDDKGNIVRTQVRDSPTSDWKESSSATAKPQPPKAPTILPTDSLEDIRQKTEQYKQELDAWSKTQKTQKGIDEVQNAYNAYIKAINTPNEAQAKAKFEATYEKFQFAQKSPSEIVSSYYSGTDEEKKLAKQVLVDGYNNPALMKELADSNDGRILIRQMIFDHGKNIEAYKVLDESYQKEMDVHLQNNEIAKKAGEGILYVPDSLVFVNKDGFIVQISLNAATGKYTATATKDKYEGPLPGVTPGKSKFTDEQQAAIAAQGLIITPDGKITDNLGNVYSSVLKYNPQGDASNKWIVDKETKTAPKTILVDGKNIPILTENSKNFETQSGLAIYKDPTGKLYDQQGNPIKDGDKVTLPSKFGSINTEIIYSIKDGKIDTENPVGARIGSTTVPPNTYAELLGFLKAAGKEPTTEGDFTKGSPLIIKNEKGDAVAITYGFTNEEGIAKGTFIQSNFKNGVALLTKISSEDGKTTITEQKEFREIEIKDADGKVIRKEPNFVTKSWIKFEEKEFADGIVSLRTERVYDSDKDGRQKNDKYTEFTTDAKTGEPRLTTIKDGNNEYIINYFESSKAVGFFAGTVQVFKNGVQISEADWNQLKTTNPDLYNKISENLKLHDQYTSQQFFANVERIFTEFQGLGYYATLFFDEDSLLKWRDNVDRAFATFYLGTEYITSTICGQYLDGEDEGIAYAETPQGLAQVGAHIEAIRTEPIITPTGTEFIYKITFNVRNGDYSKDPRAPEEMNINVILKGDKTVTVFKQNQKIERGSSFGRTGANAIVKDSKTFFNQVCLVFDKIPLRWKLDNKELCNTIQVSAGEATKISTSTTTTTTSSGGTKESEINDF